MKTSTHAIWDLFSGIFRKLFAIAAIVAVIFLTSCNKDDENEKPVSTAPGKGVVKPVGTPDGEITTKEIGELGGTISTADGKISIEIPAGALASAQNVTIQPITNTNSAGKSKAFRLSPHGIKFKKDVNITFSFTEEDIKRTIPAGLGIAFQDSTGVWKALGGTVVDKVNKTITVSTNHFSDWSFFERFWIEPWAASIEPSAFIDLKVVTVDPDLMTPLPQGETRGIDEPYEVKDSFIKEWNLDGEGILGGIKNGQSYQAPDKIPARNPVAISVELNLPEPGKFLLVSNITIGNPPHISYLQVDEEQSQMYIYGFGFLQGDDKDALVTVDGVPVKGIIRTAENFIQCWIPETGKGSSGPVVVEKNGAKSTPHILNEWNGTLVYDRPCAGKNGGSLYQKIYFKIRLRGDANPDDTRPLPFDPFMKDSKINKGSYVWYEAGGTGSTTVNNEEMCGTENVVWTHAEGSIPFKYKSSDVKDRYFTGEAETGASGFLLRLDLNAPELIHSDYTLTPCKGDGYSDKYEEPLYFQFSSYNDVIKLLFKENSSLSGGQLIGSTPVARGLHWNGWEADLGLRDATLTWGEIPAKYPNGIIIE